MTEKSEENENEQIKSKSGLKKSKTSPKHLETKETVEYKNIPIQQVDFKRMSSEIFFREITVPQLEEEQGAMNNTFNR